MASEPAAASLPERLPRAVVFDLDGLVLDSERVDRELWRAVLERRGYDFPDALHASLIGRRSEETAQLLRAHFGAGFPLEAVQVETETLWRERVASGGLRPKRGLAELLELLERLALPRAVATSTVRAKALLSLGALAQRFEALACGDEVREGKPAPDLYLLAAARLRVPPSECLALEDSPPGTVAAQAAGMTVIVIPDLIQPPVTPRYTCSSLLEVARWIEARGVVSATP